MLLTNNEVKSKINVLIDYLNTIQNGDGSFESSFYYSLYPEKGWISWGFPPFDTAVILQTLIPLNNDKLESTISKGTSFILSQSLDRLIWRYSSGQGYSPLLYDTDATAICSHVLNLQGYNIDNKILLDCFIDSENNYKTWVIPQFLKTKMPFLTFLKLTVETFKSLNFNKLNISLDDREFSMNCNILLYMGKTNSNNMVWKKVMSDFENNTIECRYYNKYYSVYAYAKLFSVGNHQELFLSEPIIMNKIDIFYEELKFKKFSLDHLFLLNSILFFKINLNNYYDLLKLCIESLQNDFFKLPFSYYSSNIIYDKNLEGSEPVNYFGSSALTTSVFLEFLYLYDRVND